MKVSTLIESLERAKAWVGGDPEVQLGWITGETNTRFDVTAEAPEDGGMVTIQAYAVKR
jgi:hypothetical protein